MRVLLVLVSITTALLAGCGRNQGGSEGSGLETNNTSVGERFREPMLSGLGTNQQGGGGGSGAGHSGSGTGGPGTAASTMGGGSERY